MSHVRAFVTISSFLCPALATARAEDTSIKNTLSIAVPQELTTQARHALSARFAQEGIDLRLVENPKLYETLSTLHTPEVLDALEEHLRVGLTQGSRGHLEAFVALLGDEPPSETLRRRISPADARILGKIRRDLREKPLPLERPATDWAHSCSLWIEGKRLSQIRFPRHVPLQVTERCAGAERSAILLADRENEWRETRWQTMPIDSKLLRETLAPYEIDGVLLFGGRNLSLVEGEIRVVESDRMVSLRTDFSPGTAAVRDDIRGLARRPAPATVSQVSHQETCHVGLTSLASQGSALQLGPAMGEVGWLTGLQSSCRTHFFEVGMGLGYARVATMAGTWKRGERRWQALWAQPKARFLWRTDAFPEGLEAALDAGLLSFVPTSRSKGELMTFGSGTFGLSQSFSSYPSMAVEGGAGGLFSFREALFLLQIGVNITL